MPQATPYYTSNDLIAAVQRKILMPINQVTLTSLDILSFLNEEMYLSQVPSVLQYHQEYFVYQVVIPLQTNVIRYPIPDRAIGMKLREIFWSDQNGNFFEMTRIQSEDKAFFQRNIGANQAIHKYYIEGNDIVLTPPVLGNPMGALNMFILLRPNQLVLNNRAATITTFSQTITINNSQLNSGDYFQIGIYNTTGDLVTTKLTAVTSSPTTNQFQIGLDSNTSANNLVSAINSTGLLTSAINNNGIITITYPIVSNVYTSWNANNQPTLGIVIGTTQGVVFNNIPTTWLNPVTNITETLFQNNSLIDFLQTNPGHRIYSYNIQIPNNGISGNTINFTAGTVPSNLTIGDYICLANESIIPYLPPDLHNGLAERACARILAALGDQAGLQASQTKINEIENRQGNLIDNRVDGSPLKVTARKSLLRYGKQGTIRRF